MPLLLETADRFARPVPTPFRADDPVLVSSSRLVLSPPMRFRSGSCCEALLGKAVGIDDQGIGFARDRTPVTIAHRLDIVCRADHVVVLERRRVVDGGPPGAVLARCREGLPSDVDVPPTGKAPNWRFLPRCPSGKCVLSAWLQSPCPVRPKAAPRCRGSPWGGSRVRR